MGQKLKMTSKIQDGRQKSKMAAIYVLKMQSSKKRLKFLYISKKQKSRRGYLALSV